MVGFGCRGRRIQARQKMIDPRACLVQPLAQGIAFRLELMHAFIQQGVDALKLGMAQGEAIGLVAQSLQQRWQLGGRLRGVHATGF